MWWWSTASTLGWIRRSSTFVRHNSRRFETTVQEMTGDWESYRWQESDAPTQNLAKALYGRRDTPMGLLAPSARNPLQDNLILFADRLPERSISYVAHREWHESQLEGRARPI